MSVGCKAGVPEHRATVRKCVRHRSEHTHVTLDDCVGGTQAICHAKVLLRNAIDVVPVH